MPPSPPPPRSENSLRDEVRTLRSQIDAIDDELLGLLHRRAAQVRALGVLKRRGGLPMADPEREALILARVRAGCAAGPFGPDAAVAIFEAVVAHCREVQLLAEPAVGEGASL